MKARTKLSRNIYTDRIAWAKRIAENYATGKNTASSLLVSDIDDTILDGDKRWYELYLDYARKQGLKESQIVPIGDFRGKPRKYIAGLVDDYDKLKRRLMTDIKFNSAMEPLETSAELMDIARRFGFPNGYLTTRVAVLAKTTTGNLAGQGFTGAPTLFRSDDIKYENTMDYKMGALIALRDALKNEVLGVRIYYVDDYKDLVANINNSAIGVTAVAYDENFSWTELAERITR